MLFNIRNAVLEDIDKIMEIEKESFEKGVIEEKSVFTNHISAFSEGFLVAEDSTDTFGYICSELWQYIPEIDVVDGFTLNHNIKRINFNEDVE